MNTAWRHLITCFFTLTLVLHSHTGCADTLKFKVEGLQGDMKKNVTSFLDIAKSHYPTPLSEKQVKQLFNQGSELIHRALEPYSYFKPHVSARLEGQNGKWLAHYTVKLGPPLRIKQSSLLLRGEGAKRPVFLKIKKQFPLQSGAPLTTAAIKHATEQLQTAAEEHGYLKAKLETNTITVDRHTYSANVNMVFDTGPQFYFGNTTFSKTPLAPEFLQRYVNYSYGQPYRTSTILKLQQQLMNSNYFSMVQIAPNTKKSKQHHLPIMIDATSSKAQLYRPSIGFGTDTGARAKFSWKNRRLNRWGHSMQVVLQASEIGNSAEARYVIPGHNPVHEQYQLSILREEQQPGDDNSTTLATQLAYNKTFRTWQRSISLNLQHDRFTEKGKETENTLFIMPQLALTRIHADKLLNASQGHRVSLSWQAASRTLLSDTNFAQMKISGKRIQPLWGRSRGVFRSTLGVTVVQNFSQLPVSLRFYTGGARSVRGYGFQSIGSGRFLFDASAEYQQHIYKGWYATGFYDVGLASNSTQTPLSKGIGVGVMWASPIGPMELTVARAIDKRGQPNRLQFTMGPDF